MKKWDHLLRRGGGLILFAAVLAFYWQSSDAEFIYDDEQVILAQPPPTAHSIARVFAERHFPHLPYYRPITRATLLLQKAIHGDSAPPFHLFNAALMALIAAIAYRFLLLPGFGNTTLQALLGAAIFAVHPIASSCVYPVSSGRETLMPALWSIGAVYAWIRGGAGARGIASVCFALALFSKEQAAIVPLLFVLADWMRLPPDVPNRNKRAWLIRYAPLVPAPVLYVAIRHALFGGSEFVLGAWREFPASILYGIQSAILPSIDLVYEPTLRIWFAPVKAVAAIGIVSACAWGVRKQLRTAPLRFWTGWFLLCLLPTANLLRQEAHYDERYVLLASLALCAMMAGLVATPRQAWAAAAVIVCAAAISFHRASFFHDNIAFSEQWLITNPDSVNAHYNLAYALAKRGQSGEAIPHYRRAVEIDPRYDLAWNNLGNALAATGNFPEAAAAYRQALAIKPGYRDASFNLATMLARSQQWEAARERFEETIRIDPAMVQAHLGRANVLAAQGNFGEAIREYAQATRLDPESADCYNNWANALASSGQPREAIGLYRKAIALRPNFTEAIRNLALVESQISQFTSH